MSLFGVGLVLLIIGLVLWLAAVAPALGYALVVIGVIVILVALVMSLASRRGAPPP